jgi:hypothetical protein
MKQCIWPIAILLLSTTAIAQHKTYLSLEFSSGNDIYEITDDGDMLKSVPLWGPVGGVTIRQELSRKWFVEAGALVKAYQEGFGFEGDSYSSATSDDNTWLIPLRIGYNINVVKKRLFLVPTAGYTLGIAPPYGVGVSQRLHDNASSLHVVYQYTDYEYLSKYISLIQGALALEYTFADAWIVSLNTGYYKGLNKFTEIDITYSVDNGPETNGKAVSYGDFWYVGVGVKYSVSNLWQKNK